MRVIHHDDVPPEPFPGGATYQTFVGSDDGETPVRLGLQVSPPGYATPHHSHPYVEILTVVEGTGAAWSDASPEEVPLSPGMTLVVPPHTRHGFRVTGDGPLKTYGIHVSPDRVVDVHGDGPPATCP